MASKESKKSGGKRSRISKSERKHSSSSHSEPEPEEEEIDVEIAPPIVKDAELQRFEDLGLGRGLNATDLTPWLNKSSFQVREVTSSNIIGTDEGGAVQSYETEVHSTFTLQSELQASIAIPQSPITIGVDAEQSRSVSSSRKSVGRKVLNRTISYRADFDDVPFRRVTSQNGSDNADGASAEAPTDIAQSKMTFEERLCKWILRCIEADEEAKAVLEAALHGHSRGNAADDLPRAFMYFPPGEKRRKLRLAIEKACSDFANTFNITHYVSAVHLGAAEYSVFTEEEYHNEMKTKVSLGVDQIGGGSASTKVTWGKSSKQADSKTIGRISEDGNVKRGSSEEAVIGIKVLPISTLIRFAKLRMFFETALGEYVAELQDLSHGPFYIATNDETLLLSVDAATSSVYATNDFHDASLFFVIPTDNAAQPNEFYITYRGEGFKPQHTHDKGDPCCHERPSIQERRRGKKGETVQTIPRYLNTPIQRGGYCPGPLQLKLNVKDHDARFTLINRIIKGSNPVSTAPWLSHRDIFFIKCARRGFNKHAFLAVQQRARDSRWTTCCVKSKGGEDSNNTFMLFRLLPKTYHPKGWVLGGERKGQGRRKSSGGTRDAVHADGGGSGAAKPSSEEAEQTQPGTAADSGGTVTLES